MLGFNAIKFGKQEGTFEPFHVETKIDSKGIFQLDSLLSIQNGQTKIKLLSDRYEYIRNNFDNDQGLSTISFMLKSLMENLPLIKHSQVKVTQRRWIDSFITGQEYWMLSYLAADIFEQRKFKLKTTRTEYEISLVNQFKWAGIHWIRMNEPQVSWSVPFKSFLSTPYIESDISNGVAVAKLKVKYETTKQYFISWLDFYVKPFVYRNWIASTTAISDINIKGIPNESDLETLTLLLQDLKYPFIDCFNVQIVYLEIPFKNLMRFDVQSMKLAFKDEFPIVEWDRKANLLLSGTFVDKISKLYAQVIYEDLEFDEEDLECSEVMEHDGVIARVKEKKEQSREPKTKRIKKSVQ